MFIWRRIRFASLASLLFAVLVVPLMTATPARAGANILTAEGGVIDDNGDTGHIVLGGLVNLDRSGGAKALDITIAYQDNRVSSGLPNHDSFVCKLTDPSDLSYAVSNGVGTATFTVASDDTCFQTANPSSTFSNSGNSISFQAYVIGSKVRMVSTASTLVDGAGDEVPNMAVSGELDPSGAGSAQVAGNRLVSGGGGAIDADDLYSGHLALAGLVELTTVTKNHPAGSAKSLDLTLTWEDTTAGNLNQSCHFTDPADVSYTLTKGVGTLTLTVGSRDTCTQGASTVTNTGNSIGFNLYAAGAKGRLVSTGSTLKDASGETLIPAVVAAFSTAGGS